MTVCVAAICDSQKAIVTASDMMLTAGGITADYLTVKGESVTRDWHALFSGDVALFLPILREATARFKPRENTIGHITTSFEEAYQSHLKNRINGEILSRYGLDLESFKQNGLKQLGEEIFNDLYRQIERTDFNCDFLVFGFDKDSNPHVFTVSNPGITEEYTRPGFWAIGSGAQSARSTLFFHGFNFLTSLPRAIYHVCEAKFMAETALAVGRETFAFIVRPSEEIKMIDGSILAEIKKAWTEEGKARVPSGIEAIIKAGLDS